MGLRRGIDNLDGYGALDQRLPEQPTGGNLEKKGIGGDEWSYAAQQTGIPAIQAELEEAKADKPKSALQDLLSPETLIKLGLGVAGYLSGDPNVQASGGGLAMGALGGAPGRAAADKTDHLAHIDKLQGLLDKAMNRLMQQQVAMPTAFLDEEGENLIKPEEWGKLMGTGVPIDIGGMYRRARESETLNMQFQTASEMMRQGIANKNPVLLRQGLRHLNEAANMGWTEANMGRLEQANTKAELLQMLTEIADPASVLEVFQQSTQMGGTILDSEWLSRLRPVSESDSLVKGMDDQIKLDAWNAMNAFDQWVKSEEGAEIYGANPHAAFNMFFDGNPAAKAAVQKVYTHLGQRADKLEDQQVESLLKAWSSVMSMDPAIQGAFSMDPEARGELFVRTAAGLMDLTNTSRGLVEVQWRRDRSKFWEGQRPGNAHREPLYHQRVDEMLGDRNPADLSEAERNDIMVKAQNDVDKEQDQAALDYARETEESRLESLANNPMLTEAQRAGYAAELKKLRSELNKLSKESRELFQDRELARLYDKYTRGTSSPGVDEALQNLGQARTALEDYEATYRPAGYGIFEDSMERQQEAELDILEENVERAERIAERRLRRHLGAEGTE